MTKTIQDEKSQKLYVCPECGLKYRKKSIAEKCGEWCRKHKSCNLETIKNAVPENATTPSK